MNIKRGHGLRANQKSDKKKLGMSIINAHRVFK
jgi:hypothetical protein